MPIWKWLFGSKKDKPQSLGYSLISHEWTKGYKCLNCNSGLYGAPSLCKNCGSEKLELARVVRAEYARATRFGPRYRTYLFAVDDTDSAASCYVIPKEI